MLPFLRLALVVATMPPMSSSSPLSVALPVSVCESYRAILQYSSRIAAALLLCYCARLIFVAGMDHMDVLGPALHHIASHKAGIIKVLITMNIQPQTSP